jgi:hypothetical protein
MTNQTKPRIKLIARNPITRNREEVYPEDEFDAREATPIFLGRDGRYYTVPGTTAAMVWDEWLNAVTS